MPTGIPKNGINKGWFKKGHLASKTAFKKGVKLTKEQIKKRKKLWEDPDYRKKQVKAHTGKVSPLKGKIRYDMIGSKHPMWKGGRSQCRAFYRARRRNLELSSLGFHTKYEWELLKVQYNWTCPCCGKSEPKIKLAQDHIIPLSKGGSDNIENIQPLCKSCNSSKHTRIIKY